MALNGQRPLQFSTGVLDSRPGLSLRQWAEDESQRAIEAELRAFGKEVKEATSVTNRPGLELPTAAVPATQPLLPAALADVRQAIFQYRMAERLCRDAKNEYARHLNNPDNLVNKYQDYSSHIDHLSALEFVSAADADYLEAMLPGTPEATRRQLWERAAVNYRNAVTWYEYLDLRYYVPGETREKWLPAGATPATLLNYRREATTLADFKQGPVRVAILQMTRVYDRVMWDLRGIDDQNQTERQEYDKYLKRASGRLRQLLQIPSVSAAGADAASDTAPPTQPSETQPATPGTPGAQPATAPATQPLGPALAPAGPNVRRPVTTN
jgi:hypothetical protein